MDARGAVKAMDDREAVKPMDDREAVNSPCFVAKVLWVLRCSRLRRVGLSRGRHGDPLPCFFVTADFNGLTVRQIRNCRLQRSCATRVQLRGETERKSGFKTERTGARTDTASTELGRAERRDRGDTSEVHSEG
jgi:hypothetical protein